MSQSMLVRTSRHATCRRVHAPAHTPCYPFILATMGMLLKYRNKLDASRLNQRILNRLRS